ncbi:hypothetical protein MAXJ12_01279, partial [Mesorhizobium alhagi CCNWXJ12-2]
MVGHVILNATNTANIYLNPLIFGVGVLLISSACNPTVSLAQEPAAGKSFVENFDGLDKKHWYVSDGW